MASSADAIKLQIARQVAHWTLAAARLRELENLASPMAWEGLERHLGAALQRSLLGSVAELEKAGASLKAALSEAESSGAFQLVREQLGGFKTRYVRTEFPAQTRRKSAGSRCPCRAALTNHSCSPTP